MQTAAVFVALLAAASATTSAVFHVPSADSAVISSQRVGGNFAYSTHESKGYGIVSPVISNIVSPVATTYTVQKPATTYTVANAPVAATTYTIPSYTNNIVSPVTYTAGVHNGLVKNVEYRNDVPITQQFVNQPHSYYYGATPVVPTTYSVQSTVAGVDAKNIAEGKTVPFATTYAVQSPVSVVASGTPAGTYKTVAGVSPLGFNYGYASGFGYPYGHGYQVVV